MVTEKTDEVVVKEDGEREVWSSLPIRAGVVITAVGMGREEGAQNIINHAAA